MSYFEIDGGRPLSGSVDVQGAKNSVLPILAASLLCKGESTIHNCPKLADVTSAFKILEGLGCKIKTEGHTVIIDSSNITASSITDELMREMRSSVVFLGAIIARCKQACISFPGGCELGPRPIDLHISALRQMGVAIKEESGKIFCKADKLCGCEINLSFQSVGATENIMLTATACKGVTRIINAAREPEIVDLQEFLIKCGFKVSGAGTSIVEIEGCEQNGQPEHTVISDRIVAATYLSACAAAGGKIQLTNVVPNHLNPVIANLISCGAEIQVNENSITMTVGSRLKNGETVRTMPYPGFPTDAQSPLMAALATARGTTLFIETIFDNRFRHAAELIRMGADIKIAGRIAVVSGVPNLFGADVEATDLRGGAALAVAGFGAKGTTKINGILHIERGYERFEEMMSKLGGQVKRVG